MPQCDPLRDRHANIGHGMIGEEGFRRILNCSHFADLPMILETPPPKENVEEGYRWSVKHDIIFSSIMNRVNKKARKSFMTVYNVYIGRSWSC